MHALQIMCSMRSSALNSVSLYRHSRTQPVILPSARSATKQLIPPTQLKTNSTPSQFHLHHQINPPHLTRLKSYSTQPRASWLLSTIKLRRHDNHTYAARGKVGGVNVTTHPPGRCTSWSCLHSWWGGWRCSRWWLLPFPARPHPTRALSAEGQRGYLQEKKKKIGEKFH